MRLTPCLLIDMASIFYYAVEEVTCPLFVKIFQKSA